MQECRYVDSRKSSPQELTEPNRYRSRWVGRVVQFASWRLDLCFNQSTGGGKGTRVDTNLVQTYLLSVTLGRVIWGPNSMVLGSDDGPKRLDLI